MQFHFDYPFAMMAFLGFFIVLAASIADPATNLLVAWTRPSCAAAEVGLLCCSIWSATATDLGRRFAGGAARDARLTSTLVLWMIYVRHSFWQLHGERPRMRRYASVLGIIGALDVPIVDFSVQWFRTQYRLNLDHVNGGPDSSMAVALRAGIFAVFAIFLALVNAWPWPGPRPSWRSCALLAEENDRLSDPTPAIP